MGRVSLAVAGALVLGVLMLASASAAADSFPLYNGAMTFPSIPGPSGPTEFSWEVNLSDDQALEQLDERHAQVYYVDGHHPAFAIAAISAHDADGASVPTTLSVSAGNVITLFVHHQAGNPAAGGASFVYPISAGGGWIVLDQGGFIPYLIEMPPPESRPLEYQAAPPVVCVVPTLKGRTLRRAKGRLRNAGCRIGDVRKPLGIARGTGRVARQSPAPGRSFPAGSAVDVTLGRP